MPRHDPFTIAIVNWAKPKPFGRIHDAGKHSKSLSCRSTPIFPVFRNTLFIPCGEICLDRWPALRTDAGNFDDRTNHTIQSVAPHTKSTVPVKTQRLLDIDTVIQTWPIPESVSTLFESKHGFYVTYDQIDAVIVLRHHLLVGTIIAATALAGSWLGRIVPGIQYS